VRDRAGKALQVAGLVLMPLALVWGLQGGAIWDEMLLFGAALCLVLVGRSLRT
jgi:hypothetical protein